MPVIQTITVWRGEDITLEFTMVPARDITGWVISLTIAKNFNNPNKLIQVTGTVTSGPNGTFSVILTSAQLDIEPGTYVYDVFRTDPGFNRILSAGTFELKADAREP
jgi:hypothetical protein